MKNSIHDKVVHKICTQKCRDVWVGAFNEETALSYNYLPNLFIYLFLESFTASLSDLPSSWLCQFHCWVRNVRSSHHDWLRTGWQFCGRVPPSPSALRASHSHKSGRVASQESILQFPRVLWAAQDSDLGKERSLHTRHLFHPDAVHGEHSSLFSTDIWHGSD